MKFLHHLLSSTPPSSSSSSSSPPPMFGILEPTTPLLSPSPMCRSRKSTSVSNPKSTSTSTTSSFNTSTPSFTYPQAPGPTNNPTSTTSSSDSFSGHSLRLSISDNPILYPYSEISLLTNNFPNKKLSAPTKSSSSSQWRCNNLRGKDTVIFQQNFSGDPVQIPAKLSAICRSHHSSIARLLGASIPSASDRIYLVYEHIGGASLRECLRNSINPTFTPLSRWITRMKIAADIAQGLEYMHVHCNTVHNRITTSGIIITEPDLNAKICHFGTADLAGEIVQQQSPGAEKKIQRSSSRRMRIEGTRGYIAPEVLAGGPISQRSDVFAFGVVVLELVSGMEPLKFVADKEDRDCLCRISMIDTAREAIGTEDEDGADAIEAEERRGRVRRWVDRRLRDSFPVEAAERLIRLALRCVEGEAWMRPTMTWVAGKVSKLYLESETWESQMAVPKDFSVSLAPR